MRFLLEEVLLDDALRCAVHADIGNVGDPVVEVDLRFDQALEREELEAQLCVADAALDLALAVGVADPRGDTDILQSSFSTV